MRPLTPFAWVRPGFLARRKRLLLALAVGVAVAAFIERRLPVVPRATVQAKPFKYASRVFFSPDGQSLAVCFGHDDRDSTLLAVWDVATGRQRMQWRSNGRVESLTFAPDGTHFAGRLSYGQIVVWDRTTGEERARFMREEWVDWSPYCQVVYSPRGRLLLHGWGQAGGDRMWDVATNTVVAEVKLPPHFNWNTVNHPGLFVAGGRGEVWVWQLDTAERCAVFALGDDADPRQVPVTGGKAVELSDHCLTPDGQILAGLVGGAVPLHQPCKVWYADGRPVREVPAADGCGRLALSPDGRLLAAVQNVNLAAAQGPSLWVWVRERFLRSSERRPAPEDVFVVDVESGREVLRVEDAHEARFAPDGRTFAVVRPGGRVTLYDVPFRRPWLKIVAWAAAAGLGTYLMGRWLRRTTPRYA